MQSRVLVKSSGHCFELAHLVSAFQNLCPMTNRNVLALFEERVGLARWLIDAELGRHDELVPRGIVDVRPVDEVDGLVAAAVPTGKALDRHPGQQHLVCSLIGLDELARAEPFERGHRGREARIVEPLLAVRAYSTDRLR